jgi:hypothetical protein
VAFLIGAVLALVFGLFATLIGLDRDRAFYPTVMAVIALLYVLFAVMGGSARALEIETIIMILFFGTAMTGFRRSLWLVVAALAAHGVYDFFHPGLFVNPGVPPWWPAFCLAYDVVAALYLAALLSRSRGGPHGATVDDRKGAA